MDEIQVSRLGLCHLSRRLGHLFRDLIRDVNGAVLVAVDQVAGLDEHPADVYRDHVLSDLDLAVGYHGSGGKAEKGNLANLVQIADGAIGNQAYDADPLVGVAGDVAMEAGVAGRIALVLHDQDARLRYPLHLFEEIEPVFARDGPVAENGLDFGSDGVAQHDTHVGIEALDLRPGVALEAMPNLEGFDGVGTRAAVDGAQRLVLVMGKFNGHTTSPSKSIGALEASRGHCSTESPPRRQKPSNWPTAACGQRLQPGRKHAPSSQLRAWCLVAEQLLLPAAYLRRASSGLLGIYLKGHLQQLLRAGALRQQPRREMQLLPIVKEEDGDLLSTLVLLDAVNGCPEGAATCHLASHPAAPYSPCRPDRRPER